MNLFPHMRSTCRAHAIFMLLITMKSINYEASRDVTSSVLLSLPTNAALSTSHSDSLNLSVTRSAVFIQCVEKTADFFVRTALPVLSH